MPPGGTTKKTDERPPTVSGSWVELPGTTLKLSSPAPGCGGNPPQVFVAILTAKVGDEYFSVPIPMLASKMGEEDQGVHYAFRLIQVALKKLEEKINEKKFPKGNRYSIGHWNSAVDSGHRRRN